MLRNLLSSDRWGWEGDHVARMPKDRSSTCSSAISVLVSGCCTRQRILMSIILEYYTCQRVLTSMILEYDTYTRQSLMSIILEYRVSKSIQKYR